MQQRVAHPWRPWHMWARAVRVRARSRGLRGRARTAAVAAFVWPLVCTAAPRHARAAPPDAPSAGAGQAADDAAYTTTTRAVHARPSRTAPPALSALLPPGAAALPAILGGQVQRTGGPLASAQLVQDGASGARVSVSLGPLTLADPLFETAQVSGLSPFVLAGGGRADPADGLASGGLGTGVTLHLAQRRAAGMEWRVGAGALDTAFVDVRATGTHPLGAVTAVMSAGRTDGNFTFSPPGSALQLVRTNNARQRAMLFVDADAYREGWTARLTTLRTAHDGGVPGFATAPLEDAHITDGMGSTTLRVTHDSGAHAELRYATRDVLWRQAGAVNTMDAWAATAELGWRGRAWGVGPLWRGMLRGRAAFTARQAVPGLGTGPNGPPDVHEAQPTDNPDARATGVVCTRPTGPESAERCTMRVAMDYAANVGAHDLRAGASARVHSDVGVMPRVFAAHAVSGAWGALRGRWRTTLGWYSRAPTLHERVAPGGLIAANPVLQAESRVALSGLGTLKLGRHMRIEAHADAAQLLEAIAIVNQSARALQHVNTGAAQMAGAGLRVQLAPAGWIRVSQRMQARWSTLEATGSPMPGLAPLLADSELVLGKHGAAQGVATWRMRAGAPANLYGTQRAPAYGTVDLGVRVWIAAVTVGVAVTNLTNVQNAQDTRLLPLPGRLWTMTVQGAL